MYQNNSTRQTAITPPNISVSRRFRTLIRTMSEFITGNRSVVKDNVRKTWKMCKTIYTMLCTSSFVNNQTHNYTVLSHHFTDRFYFSIINLFPTSFRLPPPQRGCWVQVRVQTVRSDRMSKRCHSQSKLKLYNNVLNFISNHLCNSPHPKNCQKDNSD